MLDHMTFRVTDIGRAKAFYSAALAPPVRTFVLRSFALVCQVEGICKNFM